MVNFLALRVIEGKLAIESVPSSLKEAVEARVEELRNG